MRWSCHGERFVHATPDATGFVRELFAQYGDQVADLEVRRSAAPIDELYLPRFLLWTLGCMHVRPSSRA